MVKKYDHEFPEKYFNEFLSYIDLNENEFWKTINNFRSPHLWEKIGDNWKLKKYKNKLINNDKSYIFNSS